MSGRAEQQEYPDWTPSDDEYAGEEPEPEDVFPYDEPHPIFDGIELGDGHTCTSEYLRTSMRDSILKLAMGAGMENYVKSQHKQFIFGRGKTQEREMILADAYSHFKHVSFFLGINKGISDVYEKQQTKAVSMIADVFDDLIAKKDDGVSLQVSFFGFEKDEGVFRRSKKVEIPQPLGPVSEIDAGPGIEGWLSYQQGLQQSKKENILEQLKQIKEVIDYTGSIHGNMGDNIKSGKEAAVAFLFVEGRGDQTGTRDQIRKEVKALHDRGVCLVVFYPEGVSGATERMKDFFDARDTIAYSYKTNEDIKKAINKEVGKRERYIAGHKWKKASDRRSWR